MARSRACGAVAIRPLEPGQPPGFFLPANPALPARFLFNGYHGFERIQWIARIPQGHDRFIRSVPCDPWQKNRRSRHGVRSPSHASHFFSQITFHRSVSLNVMLISPSSPLRRYTVDRGAPPPAKNPESHVTTPLWGS